MYLYDISKDEWKQLAPLKRGRHSHSCTIVNYLSSTAVLVCGGVDRSDCELYDPAKNKWNAGPSLPTTLEGSSMISASSGSSYSAFILGGYYYGYSNVIYGVHKEVSSVERLGTLSKPRGYHITVRTNFTCK